MTISDLLQKAKNTLSGISQGVSDWIQEGQARNETKKAEALKETKPSNTMASFLSQSVSEKFTPIEIIKPSKTEPLKLEPTEKQKETGKTVSDLIKAIPQGTARGGFSLGQTAISETSKAFGGSGVDEYTPQTTIEKFLLGEEPIKTLPKRIEQGAGTVEKTTGLPKEYAYPVAALGSVASTVLDFTGAGGEKNALKGIINAKTVDKAIEIGKKIGIADDLIDDFSKAAVAVKNEKEAKNLVNSYAKLQSGTKATGKVTEVVSKAIKVPQEAERKYITSVKELSPNMEQFLKGKYTPKKNESILGFANELIRTNEEQAVSLAKTGTNDEAVATAGELIKKYIKQAEKIKDDTTKNLFYEKAADIANSASKNLTEAGRSVQAASLLGRLTPEGMARYAAGQVQKYNDGVLKARNSITQKWFKPTKMVPELSGKELKEISDGMAKIQKIEDPIKKAMEIQKLQESVKAKLPSSLYDKIVTVWKAGLLTGIKTTGMNIMSNISHTLSEAGKDVPASVIDKALSIFTGKRTLALTGKGSAEGAIEGAKKGWQYLKTGFDERDIATKLDYNKVNMGKGKLAQAIQKYEESVFRVLGAEDQPFYYSAKIRSLASQAIAQAKNAKLKGKEAKNFIENLIANPTDEMIKYATLDAETAVFQNQTALGKIAKTLQKAPGGQILVPFGKTPAAVATQLINYSPVGFVNTLAKNIGKGKFDQRLFSQGIGRAITGTGVMWLGMEAYKKGKVALGYPTGEKEQKQWELEGKTPNSINVNGKWRSVASLGPVGMLMALGGYVQKGIKETGSFMGGITSLIPGAFKTVSEQTFMKGVNDALNALQNPERSFNGVASSMIGSIIPTIVADISRATDTYERRTANPQQRLVSRIPGARKILQPKVDVLGNKIETPNFFTTMFDPTRPGNPTVDKNDNVVKELKRLSDAGYTATPTQIGPRAGYKTLTPDMNTALWSYAGKLAKQRINELMSDGYYSDMDDEEKQKEIQKELSNVYVEARAKAVYESVKNLPRAERIKKLNEMKDEKLLTRQVYDEYLSM